MDQAVKSALDKYHGKQGITSSGNEPTAPLVRVLSWMAMIVIFIGAFAFCVKNEYLGANVLWEQITQLKVGEQTIGEAIDAISQKITVTFARDENVSADYEGATETVFAQSLNGEMDSSEI